MTNPRAIRVVIADDHAIWRSGVRADLGDEFDVVGESPDAPTAIERIRALQPDLALVDLNMPGGGGALVVAECARQVPIVVLTVSEAERDLLEVVAAGAVGYLTKSTRPEELRAALHRAAAGEPVFSPQLAALLLGEFRRLATTQGARVDDEHPALSAREPEVLAAVARGGSNKDIAAELYISPKTVENHVRNTLAKLHLSRRHELIRWAIDHGIN
jgi:DNA-binding NarL/FixJ family response regulator